MSNKTITKCVYTLGFFAFATAIAIYNSMFDLYSLQAEEAAKTVYFFLGLAFFFIIVMLVVLFILFRMEQRDIMEYENRRSKDYMN